MARDDGTMTRTIVSLSLLLLLAGSAAAQDVFPPERIALTRAFFEKNATSSNPMDCVTTLNAGVRILFDDPLVPTGSQIDRTMNALRGVGLAGAPREVNFYDERGRPTAGVTAPHSLRESVWDVVIGMTNGARGWSVFGLSLMDGYHSVTLNVDTSDPANPKIYWSDQWSSNGGFRLHTKASLDEEVRRLTVAWWSPVKKFKTRATLWRLVPTNKSRVLTINASSLKVRAQPSTSAAVLETASRGQRYRVLSQRGLWFEVARADGSSGWVHTAYVSHARALPPTPLAQPAEAGATVTAGLAGSLPD